MRTDFFSQAELLHLRARHGSRPAFPDADPARIRESGRPVYIFGAGGNSCGVLELLAGSNICGYIDNNSALWGTSRSGLEIFPLEGIAEKMRGENAIVIASPAKPEGVASIREQCRALNMECLDWLDVWLCSVNREDVDAVLDNNSLMRGVNIWEDGESRTIYRSLVRFRVTGDQADLPAAFGQPQYFVDLIPSKGMACFVDAGAFNGDTLNEFLVRFRDEFTQYHAFEPMAENWPRLEDLAKNDSRIHIHRAGLSDCSDTARMVEAGTSSRIDPNGEREITLVRLDDVPAVRCVTLVKMDIEGEEMAALKGAEKTLLRDRPYLAISVYHRPEDIYAIPLWIQALGLGYRLFLRHHSRSTAESVCYAIPQ